MLKCVASRHVVVRCSPNRANCTNHVTCDLLAAVVEKSVAGRDEGVVSIATRLWNDIRAIIQHVILLQIICNNTTSGIMKTGIIRIQA